MRPRYEDLVLGILSDGEAHAELEIALKLIPAIPPEPACRAATADRIPATATLAERIRRGVYDITYNQLAYLERTKVIVEESGASRKRYGSRVARRWRLVDPQILAEYRAMRDAGMIG